MGLWIASIVILCFSFLGVIIFGFSNFQETFKAKFSVLNMFPYELSYHNQGKMLLFYRFFLYLYVAFSITPALMMVSKYINYYGYFSYVVMISILFVINAVVLLTINIIQAKFVKLHTMIATVYFALSVLAAGAVSIFLINLYLSNNQNDLNFLIYGILEALLGFAILVIMLNPRLRHWAELNTKANEDGTTVIVRPRLFILAFSEWLVIFINFAVQILLLLAYL
ncbi:MAG: hypothetical protein GX816_01450 [Erysipelotrichia bacterium]|jgi:hypothetical protein|nr:hypothetical protein [Erysipelotrichia bacterium]